MPRQSIRTADFSLEMDQGLARLGLGAGTDLVRWDPVPCSESVRRDDGLVRAQETDFQLR